MRSVVDRNVVMRHIPVYPDLTTRTNEGRLGTLQRNRRAMDMKLVMDSCDMTLAQISHYLPFALCWEVAYALPGVWLVLTKLVAIQLIQLIFSCLYEI